MKTGLANCIAIVVAAVTVGSCQSRQERHQASCLEYGFKPGTVGMAQCLQIGEWGSRARAAANQNLPHVWQYYAMLLRRNA